MFAFPSELQIFLAFLQSQAFKHRETTNKNTDIHLGEGVKATQHVSWTDTENKHEQVT